MHPYQIKKYLKYIDNDLTRFESGLRDDFIMLHYYEDIGMLMPMNWTEQWCPEMTDTWEKFMYGQGYCEFGFFVRDVQRFLSSKLRSAK